jgi:putative hydrolase of the HAD superfamily
MKPPPQFIFLDIGNVLVSFDYDQGFQQIAEKTEVSFSQIKAFYTTNNIQSRLENGQLSWQDVYDAFCARFNSTVPLETFSKAAGDIFSLNFAMMPIVAAMQRNRLGLGLLSNSCQPHWDHLCTSGYTLLPQPFSVLVVSHQVCLAKPAHVIYEHAQRVAKTPADRIFFCDDLVANVDAARDAGWDAVLFTSAHQLIRDLNQRGVFLGL